MNVSSYPKECGREHKKAQLVPGTFAEETFTYLAAARRMSGGSFCRNGMMGLKWMDSVIYRDSIDRYGILSNVFTLSYGIDE